VTLAFADGTTTEIKGIRPTINLARAAEVNQLA
jgi:hypothetical protein